MKWSEEDMKLYYKVLARIKELKQGKEKETADILARFMDPERLVVPQDYQALVGQRQAAYEQMLQSLPAVLIKSAAHKARMRRIIRNEHLLRMQQESRKAMQLSRRNTSEVQRPDNSTEVQG